MSEEITAAAVRILGTEEELLPALCTAAEAGLRARLRRDVDPEKECRECFVIAAALVAASTLLSAQAQGVTDFDAGQVSLRLKDPGDSMVRRADMIVFDDAELFLWGLCVEGGREDPWSS